MPEHSKASFLVLSLLSLILNVLSVKVPPGIVDAEVNKVPVSSGTVMVLSLESAAGVNVTARELDPPPRPFIRIASCVAACSNRCPDELRKVFDCVNVLVPDTVSATSLRDKVPPAFGNTIVRLAPKASGVSVTA